MVPMGETNKATLDAVAIAAARTALAEFAAHDVLRDAVRKAVAEAFGVPDNDEERVQLRRDMIHLRSWRETMDAIRKEGIVSVMRWIVAGGLAAIVIGLGFKFGLRLPG